MYQKLKSKKLFKIMISSRACHDIYVCFTVPSLTTDCKEFIVINGFHRANLDIECYRFFITDISSNYLEINTAWLDITFTNHLQVIFKNGL